MSNGQQKKLTNVGWYKVPEGRPKLGHLIGKNTEKIELLTGGKVFFPVDGHDDLCGSGSVFWHIPGEKTIHKYDHDDPYECITINFETKGIPIRKVPRYAFWNNETEVQLFAREVLTAFHDNHYDKDLLGEYITGKLQWVFHTYQKRKIIAKYPQILRDVIQHIDKNLEQPLTIEDLATVTQKSQSYIHMLFTTHLNTSPHQYIIGKRMQKAKRLLVGSDLLIKQISDACGFDNVESFCRSFKRHFNETPGAFRERHMAVLF